ncbi:MAG: uracil-DNA glycosylase [Patescibacteria group bacterium]|mgnify:CR=1 FL=1
MSKKEELQKIKADMEADSKLPLISKPTDIIPGDGNPDAQVVFIGEAGGYNESIQRKPFVGQAGKLLDKGLAAIKVSRDDVYITNMVKTRPPNNRDPLPEELAAYEAYLDRELEIIKPLVIVTLGRFSMGKFLPSAKISAVHGQKTVIKYKNRDVTVVPMYHPAAALRNGSIMTEFKKDFMKLPETFTQVENIAKQQRQENEKPEQMELI